MNAKKALERVRGGREVGMRNADARRLKAIASAMPISGRSADVDSRIEVRVVVGRPTRGLRLGLQRRVEHDDGFPHFIEFQGNR